MNTLISLLALLIITAIGMQASFFGKTAIVKSAFTPALKFKVSSRQYFIMLLLATGIIQAGGFSALLLLIWIVFLLQLLIKYGTNFSASWVFFFYSLYLSWLVISLIQTPETEYGFRTFAKYVFPFLLVLVVSKTPMTTAFFLKGLQVSFWAAMVANLCIFISLLLPIGGVTRVLTEPILWYIAAIIDFNPFAIAVALILYRITKKRMYLYAILICIAIPIITSIRTGLVGIGVCLMMMSFFKYKVRALPYIVIVVGLFISAVVYIPNVRNKMFRQSFSNSEELLKSSKNLTTDDIDANGRFAMWEWSLDQYYKGNEIMGSGLGQLQARFYSGKHPFSQIRIVHNDYVQILCDTGLIGLVLYLLVIISFVTHSFQMYNNTQNNFAARTAAFIAGTSLCGIMACAYTDNVINYSLITLTYSYVFFGFALGLKNKKNDVLL